MNATHSYAKPGVSLRLGNVAPTLMLIGKMHLRDKGLRRERRWPLTTQPLRD